MHDQKRSLAPVIGHYNDGRPIYLVAGASQDPEPFALPENLEAVSDADLAALAARANAEFDAIYAVEGGPRPQDLVAATELAAAIQALTGEEERRVAALAALTAQRTQIDEQRAARQAASAAAEPASSSAPAGDVTPDPAAEPAETAPAETQAATPGVDTITAAVSAGVSEAVRALVAGGALAVDRSALEDARRRHGGSLNAHLRRMSEHTPDPRVTPQRDSTVLVASSDIPGYSSGTSLGSMTDLAGAMGARARNLPVTRGAPNYVPIAYMERDYRFMLDESSTPQQINEILTAATNPEVLTAAGGWCAPSEISYDFFNVVCEDGMLDLPTVGVQRGGIQFPVSPSFGDINGLEGNPWTWTETQDAAAVTGTGEKPCQRVPCPDFDEERLECDGICLTVGNLTNYAFPELIENHTRLLMAAHAHYMNLRKIQRLHLSSTPVTYAGVDASNGFIAPWLSAVDLYAFHEREKFKTCEDAIVEMIVPRWVVGAVRADLALRTGVEPTFDQTITNIISWLDVRNVRAQFVADYQNAVIGAATAPTAWPTTLDVIMYLPGTWMLGQGMRLDLGIVRDSVLNSTNDFTAAWMEDCYLVAQIGHESLRVTIPVCANGATKLGVNLVC